MINQIKGKLSLITIAIAAVLVVTGFSFFIQSVNANTYPSGSCISTTPNDIGYEYQIVVPPNVPICSGGGCTSSPFPTVIATGVVMFSQNNEILDMEDCGGGWFFPTATLNAVPSVIDFGAETVLTWSSTLTNSCTGENFSTGGATSGSASDYPSDDTTYTVMCTNGSQDVNDTAAVTVNNPSTPAPSVTLTANPSEIDPGNFSTLTWSSENATSCSGSGFATGGAISGTQSVAPLSDTTYTVTCTGGGGNASDSATIDVREVNPVTVSLTANPSRINQGAFTELSWSSQNATSCSGGGFPTGGATNGSVFRAPLETRSYSISCVNGNSGAYDAVTVTVIPEGGPRPCNPAIEDCGGGGCTGDNCGTEGFNPSCTGSPAGGASVGENVTWSATPTGSQYSYSWDGTDELSGSSSTVVKQYSTTGSKSGSITVTRGSETRGPIQCQNSILITAAAAQMSFEAEKNPVLSGTGTNLVWRVANVQVGSCSITGPGVASAGLNSDPSGNGNGTVPTGAVTTESTYTLRCTDLNGDPQIRTVILKVVPSFTEF